MTPAAQDANAELSERDDFKHLPCLRELVPAAEKRRGRLVRWGDARPRFFSRCFAHDDVTQLSRISVTSSSVQTSERRRYFPRACLTRESRTQSVAHVEFTSLEFRNVQSP